LLESLEESKYFSLENEFIVCVYQDNYYIKGELDFLNISNLK